jgi:hypothetical protein
MTLKPILLIISTLLYLILSFTLTIPSKHIAQGKKGRYNHTNPCIKERIVICPDNNSSSSPTPRGSPSTSNSLTLHCTVPSNRNFYFISILKITLPSFDQTPATSPNSSPFVNLKRSINRQSTACLYLTLFTPSILPDQSLTQIFEIARSIQIELATKSQFILHTPRRRTLFIIFCIIALFTFSLWKSPEYSSTEVLLLATSLFESRLARRIERNIRPYVSFTRIIVYFFIMRPFGAKHRKLNGMKLRINLIFIVLKLSLLNRNRIKCICMVRSRQRISRSCLLLCIGIFGTFHTLAQYTIPKHLALLAISGILSVFFPHKPTSSSLERQNVRNRKKERKERKKKDRLDQRLIRQIRRRTQKRKGYQVVSPSNSSRIVGSNLFWLILLILASPVCASTGEAILSGNPTALMVATISIASAAPSKLLVRNTMSPRIENYDLLTVPPDGHCFFHSIAHFDAASIFSHGINVQRNLRVSIIEHVKGVFLSQFHELHKTYTDQDFQNTVLGEDQTMEDFYERIQNGWGGYSDLNYISNLLNIEFRVLKAKDAQSKTEHMRPAIKPKNIDEDTLVAWLYHKDNHFSPMIPRELNEAPEDIIDDLADR